MSDQASLVTIYVAASPILAALLWVFRQRKYYPSIKGLANYIHWYNTTSTIVQAQFEPKRFNSYE